LPVAAVVEGQNSESVLATRQNTRAIESRSERRQFFRSARPANDPVMSLPDLVDALVRDLHPTRRSAPLSQAMLAWCGFSGCLVTVVIMTVRRMDFSRAQQPDEPSGSRSRGPHARTLSSSDSARLTPLGGGRPVWDAWMKPVRRELHRSDHGRRRRHPARPLDGVLLHERADPSAAISSLRDSFDGPVHRLSRPSIPLEDLALGSV